jgi:4-alpha-glucanotransferase
MTDAWGITDGYHDVAGNWHPTSPETREALRTAMGDPLPVPPQWFVPQGDTSPLQSPCELELEDGTTLPPVMALPPDLPLGYHDLRPMDGGPTTRLVIHPRRLPLPERQWGLAVQLYSLWSEGSWGIGDLADVAVLGRRLHAAGGGLMLLSPLHAPSPSIPQELSPYYPSSRRWRSPMLVRPRALRPPSLRCDPGQLIDRDLAWRERRAALAFEHAAVVDEPVWRAWADGQGWPLTLFARWSVLAERYGPAWPTWPPGLRRPDDPELERVFADPALAGEADFHRWMQWRARESVDAAAQAGAGLVHDLAVGFGPEGFDAWLYQDLLALDVRIGAPPDGFNPEGQDWGLPGLVPTALAAAHFDPLVSTVRNALHGAVGLRVDHVMGLFRQYWIPPGADATDGAYVRFAGREQLAILALEAARAGAFLVGEDLGTVEPVVRETMAELGVLGTLVAQFHDDPPEEWRLDALATLTTHDLPTSAGLWAAHPTDDARRRNLGRLAEVPDDAATTTMLDGAHRALLTSPPVVRLLTCEDLCGATYQPNVPGTVGPPNWSHRLPVPVHQIPVPRSDA